MANRLAKLAAIKRASRKAHISEREEPGESEDRAETSQYEAGEEGQEPIGSRATIQRATVGNITPRKPRRPF